uniref:Uncharacterized protein n=1 Tax=Grammatophora oceanica TaxID=210454 RepID=A0A7S1V1B3_9STRA|mmetsp:Transcript_33781/g.50098  ORF Transcript_33781/g.50098 Transcript_33781/m.50098 type:complete len:264 (+) Transcript_33781:155-946(+)
MPTQAQIESSKRTEETIATSMEDLAKQVPNEEERNKMVLCGNASTSKVKDSGYGEHKANIKMRNLVDKVGAQFVATEKSSDGRKKIVDALVERIKKEGLTFFYHDKKADKGPKWVEHIEADTRAKLSRRLNNWKPKEAAADASSNKKNSNKSTRGEATAVLPSLATPSNDDDGGMDTEGVSNNISAIEDSKMHATVDSPLRKKQKTSPTIDEIKELENRNMELENRNKALMKRCKALEDGHSMLTAKREASDAGRPDNIISGP